ncbi:MAG TPA: hypothetical protein VGE45_08305 [Chloroflexia bacterium]|jgi:hypothetical protein
MDYFEYARTLRVIDIWKPNETGYITPRELYDPAVVTDCYPAQDYQHWMDHGTVGTDTLRYWCTRGSINDGVFTLAQFLLPHQTQRYADNSVHDTRRVIFKMVQDGRRCRHTGACNAVDSRQVNNRNTLGVEYESLQNGTHDIDDDQYIKGAFLFAYNSALGRIPDHRRLSHGIVATPTGRRTDPWAGGFDYARSWAIVQAIRLDARIWGLWGLPQPQTKAV